MRFICEPIEVFFDTPPLYEKKPDCPARFRWDGEMFEICESLSEWCDFTRRGRMGRNMQPGHSQRAGEIGSLNVGRFYFQVRVVGGRGFELYFDRAMNEANDRKGHWFLLKEFD